MTIESSGIWAESPIAYGDIPAQMCYLPMYAREHTHDENGETRTFFALFAPASHEGFKGYFKLNMSEITITIDGFRGYRFKGTVDNMPPDGYVDTGYLTTNDLTKLCNETTNFMLNSQSKEHTIVAFFTEAQGYDIGSFTNSSKKGEGVYFGKGKWEVL